MLKLPGVVCNKAFIAAMSVEAGKMMNGDETTDAWMDKARPVDMRRNFREGKFFRKQTCGISKGFIQANLTMLHKSIAGDFAEFCRANSGPLPVVCKSEVGQFTAPKISQEDSDIRTDLPAYVVFEGGKQTDTVKDLLCYGDGMNDFVFFYLGCSFSFDIALLQAGIPLRCLEQQCNVSMYKTGIRCHAVGDFDCCQIVSMRPIPRHLVEKAFRVTHPMSDVHGAPVNIGNPAAIGISDISKPDYGDVNRFHDDDIPVFWSCGVTGLEAIHSAKPSLAFTHCPGSMYISDTPLQLGEDKIDNLDPADLPKVIPLADEPYLASVASEAVVDQIKKLEELTFEDEGHRHIEALLVPDDLLKSALALSHSSSVLITAGFPCLLKDSQPYESDGISGSIAIATILQALGKTVTLVVDKGLYGLMKKVVDSMLTEGIIHQAIPLLQYPPPNTAATMESAREFLTLDDHVTPKYDHLVALERAGQAGDGKFYTMRAIDMSHLVDSSDYLFDVAKEMPLVFTTGIGDGGNELGMGKVYDKVVSNIPKGDIIACKTSADYLITCGICNWGGYALAVALYLLKTCPIHERYQRRAVGFPPTDKEKELLRGALPSVERERQLLELLVRHDMKDGITGCAAMTIDTLPFDGVIDNKIKQMLEMVQ